MGTFDPGMGPTGLSGSAGASRTTLRLSWTAQQVFVAYMSAVFIFALIAIAPSVIPDGDPFWHIAAGEWILTHGEIPTTDPFSHTFAGAPWTAHEWLSEIILALTYRTFGLSGLFLLVALAGMTTALLLARGLLKYLDPLPALIVLQFALANVMMVAHARPQFLTFPIIVYWFGELIESRRQNRAPHWTLLPIMVVWANLHGGFILGLALLGPFALEAVLVAGSRWQQPLRSWTLFALGALAAALINPSGIDGLVFPLRLMSMSAMAYISEWQSMTFNRFGPFEAALLATLFFCLLRGVRIPLIRLGLLLALLHQALAHRRFTIVFAIGAALLLAEPIAQSLRAKNGPLVPTSVRFRTVASATTAVFVGIIFGLRLAFPLVITDAEKSPVTALANVPESLLQQPVFNEYSVGGFLILKGVRPFIDGRADMYGDEFMRKFGELEQQEPAEIERMFAQYGLTWAIVYPRVQRERLLERLPGWHRHYKDEYASVYIRGASTSAAGGGAPATGSISDQQPE